MALEWLDLPILAAAAVLLFSGLPKIANPEPIAATMEVLHHQVSDRLFRPGGSAPDLYRVGRLLGLTEAGVAAWVVLEPSWAAAAALTLLAAGFAAAGLIGASTGVEVACACFGKRGRPLGYAHALWFPAWVGAAWSVARAGGTQSLDERLLVLAACVGCVSTVHVGRMWAAVMPLARDRRQAAARVAPVRPVGHREAEWLLPR